MTKKIPYAGLIVYKKGVRYRPVAFCGAGQTPPEREAGDIKGWSLASRRRMREWLMTHNGPDGWSAVAVDLTFPALPVGSVDPLISREDAISVFRAFGMRMMRAGWGIIWRLEVQPRTETRRKDIRGKEQPHYHCIGTCPPGVDPDTARSSWLAVLGSRGAVRGAGDHAARVAVCDDWTGARIRYLHDHASKAKLEQVAVGWGRHWGVVGRRVFVEESGRRADLTRAEEFEAARILRKLIRRRIVDPRAFGGVNWSRMEIEDKRGGFRVSGIGWGFFVAGGCSNRLQHDRAYRREIERRIVRVEGAARRNVWALRLTPGRSPVGWRFGIDGDKLCEAGRRVAAWKHDSVDTNPLT